MKARYLFISLVFFSLESMKPQALPSPRSVSTPTVATAEMSLSTLHLERIVTDTEDLEKKKKTHEERSILDIRERTESSVVAELADLTAAIYFKDNNYPLREYINHALQKKIANAKRHSKTASSVSGLQLILSQQRHEPDLKKSIDLAHSDEQISQFIHKTVMESIEDAFVEKENEIERQERLKRELAHELIGSQKRTRWAFLSNVGSVVTSAGITAAIILGTIYGRK